MADIAAVFHWSFDTMQLWGVEELARWHARALQRWKIMSGQGAD